VLQTHGGFLLNEWMTAYRRPMVVGQNMPDVISIKPFGDRRNGPCGEGATVRWLAAC